MRECDVGETQPLRIACCHGQCRRRRIDGKELPVRPLHRQRQLVVAALDVLRQRPEVDQKRIAAIGYCFGGTCVLELAYSAPNLTAAVTFHGGLTAPDPADFPQIKAHFLILHGADDPTVTAEQIAATQKGLREAQADWEMIYYGGAVHGFSNPANDASPDHTKVAYNAEAARRSWETMGEFFKEILEKQIGATPDI